MRTRSWWGPLALVLVAGGGGALVFLLGAGRIGAGPWGGIRVAERDHAETPRDQKRWWLAELGLEAYPFEWVWDAANESVATMLPCEVGFLPASATNQVRNCDARCPRPTPTTTHFASCAVDAKLFCKPLNAWPRIPRLEMRDKRPLRSLVDVAALLSARHPPSDATVAIEFMGDSVAEQMFNWAKCGLARAPGVRYVPPTPRNKSNGTWAPTLSNSDAAENPHVVRWIRRATFDVPSLKLRVRLALVRNNRPASDAFLLERLGSPGLDLLVMNWGLHYSFESVTDFTTDMDRVVKALSSSRPPIRGEQPILVFASHFAQHFPWRADGTFVRPASSHQTDTVTCSPLRVSVEQADWNTRELRRVVQAHGLVLEPTPWGRTASARDPCPSNNNNNDDDNINPKKRLHWLPVFDVTADLPTWHVGGGVDCTHLRYLPSLAAPLWDAMYWTVVRETPCDVDIASLKLELEPRQTLRSKPTDRNIRLIDGSREPDMEVPGL